MSHSLSPKHGLNPSVEQCFTCMKDVGVIMFGKQKQDAKAPPKVCLGSDSEPCDECKGFMETGIVLISIDEAKTDDIENPFRTGGWVVVREEAIRRVVQPPELVDIILKRRLAFVPDEAWDMWGLPRNTSGPLSPQPRENHEQE